MTNKSLLLSLPVCVLIALLAAFILVSPAFAQDELPPQAAPTEAPVEVLPTEAAPVEVVPTEVTPIEAQPNETAPTEVLPTDTTPVEEPQAETTPVIEATTTEPSLAETLDEAGVVLADSSGQPLTLASSSAETLIYNGDRFFTSGGIVYRFMEDCTGLTVPRTRTQSRLRSPKLPQDMFQPMVLCILKEILISEAIQPQRLYQLEAAMV